MKLKPLRIGDLETLIPTIQGAMGIKVSTFSLAAAVTFFCSYQNPDMCYWFYV